MLLVRMLSERMAPIGELGSAVIAWAAKVPSP